MRRPALTIAAAALAAAFSTTVLAQKTTEMHAGKGGSPHVKTEWTIDGANISVAYGRPFLKGRTVGKDVAPYGKPWRTGADEATTLTTDRALKFGTTSIPAGTYTIFTMPGESQWHLIVNKQTGQWGTQYDKSQDLAHIPMTVGKAASPAEQLTISIDDTAAGGTLRIEWGTTSASVPFTVG